VITGEPTIGKGRTLNEMFKWRKHRSSHWW